MHASFIHIVNIKKNLVSLSCLKMRCFANIIPDGIRFVSFNWSHSAVFSALPQSFTNRGCNGNTMILYCSIFPRDGALCVLRAVHLLKHLSEILS